jgi:hypothetical protein
MISVSPSRWETLRDSNRRLCFWLDSMVPRGEELHVTPEHMAALLSELLRTGTELRSLSIPQKGNDPALDQELEAYRSNVERLRVVLPVIHAHLLAERARLEAQQARVRSAAEWARASRQTLVLGQFQTDPVPKLYRR